MHIPQCKLAISGGGGFRYTASREGRCGASVLDAVRQSILSLPLLKSGICTRILKCFYDFALRIRGPLQTLAPKDRLVLMSRGSGSGAICPATAASICAWVLPIGTSSRFDVCDEINGVGDRLEGGGFDMRPYLELGRACDGDVARREPGVQEEVEIPLSLSIFLVIR